MVHNIDIHISPFLLGGLACMTCTQELLSMVKIGGCQATLHTCAETEDFCSTTFHRQGYNILVEKGWEMIFNLYILH